MCLSIIKKEFVTKKSYILYKFVKMENNKEYSPINGFPEPFCLSKRTVKADISNRIKTLKDEKFYNSGIHGYFSERVALKNKLSYLYGLSLKKYIIPKGTKIVIGMETGLNDKPFVPVVVTPVLINPRVKSELSDSKIDSFIEKSEKVLCD